MAHNRVLQWATFARSWWIYDAYHQCPFESAKRLCIFLQGQHKPIYHPLSDIGDHVVVINTKDISMKNEYWRKWRFHHHTGYPGGYSQTSAWRLHDLDDTKILHKAVYSRLPGNLLRRRMMRRLHLFPDTEVPDDILQNVTDQIRQVQLIPKPIHKYSKEDIDNFPKLFDWPEEYVIDYSKKKKDEDTEKYF
ncbi:hypothetical protein SNE40_011954 [Patella caerulea]|uniref:39S ribosomal protein L13, mitochondrial n=1 Tax=Patella caerulea TaxID=87958 RepID=A0AAN8PYS9_PATCE